MLNGDGLKNGQNRWWPILSVFHWHNAKEKRAVLIKRAKKRQVWTDLNSYDSWLGISRFWVQIQELFCFWKENSSVISLILNTNSKKHECSVSIRITCFSLPCNCIYILATWFIQLNKIKSLALKLLYLFMTRRSFRSLKKWIWL